MLLAWAKVENSPWLISGPSFICNLLIRKHLRREAFHISAFTNVEICRYLRQLWKCVQKFLSASVWLFVAFKILTCSHFAYVIRKMWLYYLLKSKAFLANVSFKQPYFKYKSYIWTLFLVIQPQLKMAVFEFFGSLSTSFFEILLEFCGRKMNF